MSAAQLRLVLRRLDRVEARWCHAFNRSCRRRWIHGIFATVSWLGNGTLWYGMIVGLAIGGGAVGRRAAAHMAAVGLAGLLVYTPLKHRTLRERPFVSHDNISSGLAPLDRFSFPSGHTLHAVAFSAIAVSYFPALAWILTPFAALTGVSRIVLGLHYPSDVIAGAVIGLLLAYASFSV